LSEKAEEDVLIKAACRGGRLDDLYRGMFLFDHISSYSFILIKEILDQILPPIGYSYWWKDNTKKDTWPCVKLYLYH
jgi:hypothetical protein